MIKIAFCGGPGCGKTSLARQLTTELYNKRHLNAQQVTEFARDYINECRRDEGGDYVPSMADQMLIFHNQINRERMVCPVSVDYMITDSPVFLPIIFAYPLFDQKTLQSRRQYLSIYEEWLSKNITDYAYDYLFLLKREKPFLKDGTRGEDETQAIELDMKISGFLNMHGLFPLEVQGTDEERVQRVLRAIGAEKCEN